MMHIQTVIAASRSVTIVTMLAAVHKGIIVVLSTLPEKTTDIWNRRHEMRDKKAANHTLLA